MKLLESFRDLKIGQKVAWRPACPDEEQWVCICQVKGFYKKTTYPIRRDCSVYTSTERVVFDVLTKNNNSYQLNSILLGLNRKNEIDSPYSYERELWEVYLLENERDYIEVLKNILVDSL